MILAEAAAVTSAISGEAFRRRATPFISLRPIGRNSCRRSARVVDVDHKGAEIRVGADGIAIHTGASSRFLSHAEIADAYSPAPGRVLLQRRDGTIEEVRTLAARELLDALAEAQRRTPLAAPLPPVALTCLDGEEESLAERAPHLLSSDAYRSGVVDPSEAERVASHPKADPVARAAAMRALADAPEETRVKLRVAVCETANPVVREVLEEALAGVLDGPALRSLHDPDR